MKLTKNQPDKQQKSSVLLASKSVNNQEIISIKECQQYIGGYDLSDQRIVEIRNNMIGIIDQIINTYLMNAEYRNEQRLH